MGSLSSINFKPIKSNSERHNERIGELDYVYPDLKQDNETWKIDEINSRHSSIVDLTKELTGRKIQAKATPIREAVVNLQDHHSMDDLKNLTKVLKEEKGIDAFQIHIHRDEGKSREDLNYHAHIVFDWQDKETGKSFKLKRQDMSEIQDIAARELGMGRGEAKENSNRVRLEAVEYKRSQEEKKLNALQEQTVVLEQKKNDVDSRINELDREREILENNSRTDEDRGEEKYKRAAENFNKFLQQPEEFAKSSEETIAETVEFAKKTAHAASEEIRKTEERLEDLGKSLSK
jgi:hypothetical protein